MTKERPILFSGTMVRAIKSSTPVWGGPAALALSMEKLLEVA